MQLTPAAANIGDASEPVHAIHSGEIVRWDVLESLLHYSLYEQLGWVEGAEAGCLMVEPALTSRSDRELLTQLMFETFNVSGYFATDSAVASLAAAGKVNGLVVDIGDQKIDVVPVLEGIVQPSAATRIPYGGQTLTEHLQAMLRARGVEMSVEAAEKMKVEVSRELCYRDDAKKEEANKAAEAAAAATAAAATGDSSNNNAATINNKNNSKGKEQEMIYTLPDGQKISLEKETTDLRQALLFPSLLGLNHLCPLAETVLTAGLVTTLHGGDKDMRRVLAENILVCGGGATIPGLPQQLLREVAAISHPSLPPALCSIPEYMPKKTAHRAAWIGGAALAKVVFGGGAPQQLHHPISKADYDELGPAVVHRKCT